LFSGGRFSPFSFFDGWSIPFQYVPPSQRLLAICFCLLAGLSVRFLISRAAPPPSSGLFALLFCPFLFTHLLRSPDIPQAPFLSVLHLPPVNSRTFNASPAIFSCPSPSIPPVGVTEKVQFSHSFHPLCKPFIVNKANPSATSLFRQPPFRAFWTLLSVCEVSLERGAPLQRFPPHPLTRSVQTMGSLDAHQIPPPPFRLLFLHIRHAPGLFMLSPFPP